MLDRSKVIELLRGVFLFRGLNDAQLDYVCSQFDDLTLRDGERLFSQGDPGNAFYIIFKGRVVVSRKTGTGPEEATLDKLEPGDFFGEEALLYERPRSATITAEGSTTLLRLDYERLSPLMSEFPQIKPNLALTVESRRLAQKLKFGWLKSDEVIHQIRRRHLAHLLFSLLWPGVFALSAVMVISLSANPTIPELVWTFGVITSAVFFAIAFGWGIWQWIDWGNDYFILTNQRVVWVEQVIWLYDSRDEVPLSTVQAIDVRTGFWGRRFGFGDVMVRTYTGELILNFIGRPYQMATAIEEYWQRVKRRSIRSEAETMERAIHAQMGLGGPGEAAPGPEQQPIPSIIRVPKPEKKPGLRERYFSNFLKFRFEVGDTITYRKYWPVLLGKTWKPVLAILLTIALTSFLVSADLFRNIPALSALLSPQLLIPLSIFIVIILLLPWWFYHYLDWRNDIYQVTDRFILDIERKPFGTELKKSAPLDNILSLEHERLGIIGYFINYGNVVISVGETQFIFLGIHDPARAQQDVFNRMDALRRLKEQTEAKRDREHLAEAIGIYHRALMSQRQRSEQYNHDQEER